MSCRSYTIGLMSLHHKWLVNERIYGCGSMWVHYIQNNLLELMVTTHKLVFKDMHRMSNSDTFISISQDPYFQNQFVRWNCELKSVVNLTLSTERINFPPIKRVLKCSANFMGPKRYQNKKSHFFLYSLYPRSQIPEGA